MAVWQMKSWQSPTGYFHCGCVDKLSENSNAWWIPARILNISPAAFVELLIKEYHPEKISYNKDKNLLLYSFKNELDMKKFMRMINAKARQINYQI